MGGYGRLFIYKLMAPKRRQQEFTYFGAGENAKLLPSYEANALKWYKIGLKFLNQTKQLGDPTKREIFQYVGAIHAENHKGFYSGNKRNNNIFDSEINQIIKEGGDVLTGSPLLDDISFYRYGDKMQDLINPTVADALGLEFNHSVASALYNRALLPTTIKKLSESSIMPYSPKAYINAGVSGNKHPAIHGIKDYLDATTGKASALLGDALNQNLVYDKAGHTKIINETTSLTGEGRKDAKAHFASKVDCK